MSSSGTKFCSQDMDLLTGPWPSRTLALVPTVCSFTAAVLTSVATTASWPRLLVIPTTSKGFLTLHMGDQPYGALHISHG